MYAARNLRMHNGMLDLCGPTCQSFSIPTASSSAPTKHVRLLCRGHSYSFGESNFALISASLFEQHFWAHLLPQFLHLSSQPECSVLWNLAGSMIFDIRNSEYLRTALNVSPHPCCLQHYLMMGGGPIGAAIACAEIGASRNGCYAGGRQ